MPDNALLLPLAEAGCGSCANLQEHAVDLARAQQRTTERALRVNSASPRKGAPIDQQFVTIELAQLGATTVSSEGEVVDRDPVQVMKREVALVWLDERWLLYGISAWLGRAHGRCRHP